MKTLNIPFEEEELKYLERVKNICGCSWKDLIIGSISVVDKQELRKYFYIQRQREDLKGGNNGRRIKNRTDRNY